MKVLVLGAYGNFGARICRALRGDAGIELLVAARDAARVGAFARELGAAPVTLDTRDPALAERLAATGAHLVIHTAGPFQGQDYGVARAAAAAGCHYIDLADGRRFVCDFARELHDEFVGAGRTGITGASTVPALSSAVVDACLPRFGQLEGIDSCIAPAQRAPRGEATVAGVLSYCGEPVQVWKDGGWQALPGWADPQPVQFARLKPRRGALCDIPDLELFPGRYAGVRAVMFRAALEVRLSQSAFAWLAAVRGAGLRVASPGMARWIHRGGRVLDPFGTSDGGMVVRMAGTDPARQPLQLAWHLTAPDHHGPEIPAVPAILLARRLARGESLPPGAHACMGLLRLEDFAPEFARWRMRTELLEEQAQAWQREERTAA